MTIWNVRYTLFFSDDPDDFIENCVVNVFAIYKADAKNKVISHEMARRRVCPVKRVEVISVTFVAAALY